MAALLVNMLRLLRETHSDNVAVLILQPDYLLYDGK